MKICPNCKKEVDNDTVFCTGCGVKFPPVAEPQPTVQQEPVQQTPPPVYQPVAPAYDPFDHTAEFDAKDISDNKVISMLVYLMGPIGIVIALLAANNSAYAGFHVRQALKISVVEILASICTILTFWTVIVPFAYMILSVALLVIKIICFFQICSGKAKEPAIVRSLKFLK